MCVSGSRLVELRCPDVWTADGCISLHCWWREEQSIWDIQVRKVCSLRVRNGKIWESLTGFKPITSQKMNGCYMYSTTQRLVDSIIYYVEESVLLGTKPLVDSIRHFIRDPSGVFSVCHLCECRIVQWRHDSRFLLLLNWFLPIIKRTLHVSSKIWILCSRGKNNISNIKFISSRHRVISSIYALLTKCEVKIAGYRPSSFFAFLLTET